MSSVTGVVDRCEDEFHGGGGAAFVDSQTAYSSGGVDTAGRDEKELITTQCKMGGFFVTCAHAVLETSHPIIVLFFFRRVRVGCRATANRDHGRFHPRPVFRNVSAPAKRDVQPPRGGRES